jgi:outer membrane protein TolC
MAGYDVARQISSGISALPGGVDTLLNALDADRDPFNAELSLTQTRRNEVLSIVQLYKRWAVVGSNNDA